jgi:hypothetical protein
MTTTKDRVRAVDRRTSLAAGIAIASGIAVALIDSSPGWDDTGVTAGFLFLGAGGAAVIARERPWLWALLVGLPTPILETAQGGSPSSWLAVVFAGAGAAAGWGVARAVR